MKEKFQRFMIGRYGVDELGKYSLYLTIALLILGLFVRSRFLNGVTFLIVLLLYFRMFSKNYAQRRKENDLFLKYKNQVVLFFNKEKRMMQDRVKFHIYTCPSCHHLSEMQKRIHQKKLKSDFSFFYVALQLRQNRSAGFEEIFFFLFAQV